MVFLYAATCTCGVNVFLTWFMLLTAPPNFIVSGSGYSSINDVVLPKNEHPPTCLRTTNKSKQYTMLRYAVIFFIVALVAGFLGFGGIAAGAAGIAKILFWVFLVLLVISLLSGAIKKV